MLDKFPFKFFFNFSDYDYVKEKGQDVFNTSQTLANLSFW